MSIRILVADDHEIVRVGLKSLLRGTDIKFVGEAATSEAAIRLAQKHSPDLILLDVQMPGNDGLWALAKLKSDRPDLPVLMWSAFDNPTFVARAVALGANGYVLKTATRDELVRAIQTAAAGDTTWTRAELRRVGNALATPRTLAGVEAPLTQRESEVLKELAQGATNKEIARTLGISFETVKEHVGNIFRKIGARDRTQVAIWAVRNNLI
jgi:DNA-binding NarL/FixJ family response regulator